MTGNRRNELNPQDSRGGQGGRAEERAGGEEEEGGGDDGEACDTLPGLIQKARLFPSPYHSSHSWHLNADLYCCYICSFITLSVKLFMNSVLLNDLDRCHEKNQ